MLASTALEKMPCGSASTSASGSAGRVRCRESDSPGSRPLPSQARGASMSDAGLEVDEGRAGAGAKGPDFGDSSSAVPPYLRSDSPGRTKGAGAWPERGEGAG